jgi:hypothetical protein
VNAKEVGVVMAGLAEVYEKELTAGLIQVYTAALQDLTIEDLQRAAGRHLNDATRGQFWPKPADLRFQAQGDTQLVSIRAWNKAIEAAERHGSLETVVFDDPAIQVTIRQMGGWVHFCARTTDQDTHWIERDFREQYAAVQNANSWSEKLPRLEGTVERDNRRRGFLNAIPEPKLIGDKVQAKQVAGSLEESKLEQLKHSSEFIKKLEGMVDEGKDRGNGEVETNGRGPSPAAEGGGPKVEQSKK